MPVTLPVTLVQELPGLIYQPTQTIKLWSIAHRGPVLAQPVTFLSAEPGYSMPRVIPTPSLIKPTLAKLCLLRPG